MTRLTAPSRPGARSGVVAGGLHLLLRKAAVFLLATIALTPTGGALAQARTCPPVAQAATPRLLDPAQPPQARDRGFLWRIGRDGRTSYLFGTIHLGRLEWTSHGPKVLRALRDTDTLALELDLGDPRTALEARSAMSRPTIGTPLPESLRQRLQRQFDAACLPPASFEQIHPVMQAVALATLAGRWDGLDPAYSQESVLAARARSAHQPIVALERAERQIAALLPDQDDRVRSMVDEAVAQLEDGRMRRQLQRLAAAWERGDLAALEQHESWCECVHDEQDRKDLRRLNDDRNPGLADRIDALHRDGRKVFAAVGALHMVGPRSLPALMRSRGYDVERILFAP